MQLVMSGRTAVNINGEVGPYFLTGQGVRQEDPISSFIFNLVVDALASILDLAKRAGHIRGICLLGNAVISKKFLRTRKIMVMHSNEGRV